MALTTQRHLTNPIPWSVSHRSRSTAYPRRIHGVRECVSSMPSPLHKGPGQREVLPWGPLHHLWRRPLRGRAGESCVAVASHIGCAHVEVASNLRSASQIARGLFVCRRAPHEHPDGTDISACRCATAGCVQGLRAYEDQDMKARPARPRAHFGVGCAQRRSASWPCSSYGRDSSAATWVRARVRV